MLQLTKKAIVEATLQTAQVRPLNKITVRDIVEACGITRNTFYYHFHDIYEVMECWIDLEFSRIKEKCGNDSEQIMFELVDLCALRKKVLVNLYKTIGAEQLSASLTKHFHDLLIEQLLLAADGLAVEQRDLELIASFYEAAFIGLLLRFLKEDKKDFSFEALHAAVERVHIIFAGQLRLCLENSAKNPSQGR